MNKRGMNTGESVDVPTESRLRNVSNTEERKKLDGLLLEEQPVRQPAANSWLSMIKGPVLSRLIFVILIIVGVLSPSPLVNRDCDKVKLLSDVLALPLINETTT
jgi:hypothetical protein